MALIIGDIHPVAERPSLPAMTARWLTSRISLLFSSRRNPSPYPDRIWRRHSALLEAARRSSLRG
jgi:hypothetical protein